MFKQMLRFLAAVVKLYDFEEGGVICLVVCYNRYENFECHTAEQMLKKKLYDIEKLFINVSQGIRRKNVNN